MAAGLAGWLREQRIRSELTQAQLAAKLGKTQTWVSQVETGKVHPTADEAAAFAYHTGGSVLDALDQGGYLNEPPWVRRIEDRLDRIEKLCCQSDA